MRTATPATLIPKPVPVGLHVSRKDFYRMGNKSRQFRRNCRRNIDKCRNVDIRPLNGKTKDREVPCFCRGCDVQQCKFLPALQSVATQLPRSTPKTNFSSSMAMILPNRDGAVVSWWRHQSAALLRSGVDS